MQKWFSRLILTFTIAIFLVACNDCEECTSFPTLPPTLHPDAIAPMTEISAWNATCFAGLETVQVLGETATVASYTLTPTITLTPTETPTPSSTIEPTYTPTLTITPVPPATLIPVPKTDEIKEQLNEKLRDAFAINSFISSVEFIPTTGDNPYVNFVVKMTCSGNVGESSYCTSMQVLVDVINACEDSNDNKTANLVPERTEIMRLQVMHPNNENTPQVFFDVNWADVQSYKNKTITAEEFKDRVRILTP